LTRIDKVNRGHKEKLTYRDGLPPTGGRSGGGPKVTRQIRASNKIVK
jgi:hypothetical protein